MCSHYEAPSAEHLKDAFGDSGQLTFKLDLWPGYEGPFVRSVKDGDADTPFELHTGVFGLLPSWAKDPKLARSTYNARSETASKKNSFRHAWARAQHCLIPAAAIYEPDWRSGKAVPTRITRSDGGVMCIAGLWEERVDEDGATVRSYSMLTINADDHAFFSNYHRPNKEKRSVVILPNGLIRDWLVAPAEASMEFMRPYPADRLVAEAQ